MYNAIVNGCKFKLLDSFNGGYYSEEKRVIVSGYDSFVTLGHESSHHIFARSAVFDDLLSIYRSELENTDSAAFAVRDPQKFTTDNLNYYSPFTLSANSGYKAGVDELFAESMGTFLRNDQDELLFMYLPKTINTMLYQYAAFIKK